METITVQITSSSWTQILADTDSDWIIQNPNSRDVLVKYASAQPADVDNTGIIIKKGEGLTSATHGVGNVWVTLANLEPIQEGKITVTK